MKKWGIILVLCCVPLGTAACGGGAAPTSPGTSGHVTKVTFVQSQSLLPYAPAYIARAKGYFKEAGLAPVFDVVKGGAAVIAAMASGSAQFGLASAPLMINADAKGLQLESTMALDFETVDTVVSKKWVDAHHVSRTTPVKQRILALKGATIGYTSPGALSETMARYLVEWAGLNPKTDVTFAAIGGAAARQAALKAGQIQAYLNSPPAPEQAEADGFGYVLIPAKDLPGFSHVISMVLVVRKGWAKQNAGTIRKVTAALVKGSNFVRQHPHQTGRLLKQFFPKVSNSVMKQSLNTVRTALIPGGVTTASDWQQSARLLIRIKAVKKTVGLKKGTVWTNQYLKAS